MAEYVKIGLGKYSTYEKLRDIFTILLFISQPSLWFIYGTSWSLILPAVFCGGMAAYFMIRADNLYKEIWQKLKSGIIKITLMLNMGSIGLIILANWIDNNNWVWIGAICIADAAFIYSVAVIGWLRRDVT